MKILQSQIKSGLKIKTKYSKTIYTLKKYDVGSSCFSLLTPKNKVGSFNFVKVFNKYEIQELLKYNTWEIIKTPCLICRESVI